LRADSLDEFRTVTSPWLLNLSAPQITVSAAAPATEAPMPLQSASLSAYVQTLSAFPSGIAVN
jgi:hypothetical protein